MKSHFISNWHTSHRTTEYHTNIVTALSSYPKHHILELIWRGLSSPLHTIRCAFIRREDVSRRRKLGGQSNLYLPGDVPKNLLIILRRSSRRSSELHNQRQRYPPHLPPELSSIFYPLMLPTTKPLDTRCQNHDRR